MSWRLQGMLAAVLCLALCSPAARTADRQFLVTVLRSSDPVQVRELLGRQPVADSFPRRDIRAGGYRRGDVDRWQVIVSEGRPAHVMTGGAKPQLRIPLVGMTRHGPVPHVATGWRDFVQGVHVQASPVRGGVEVQLDWFTGNSDSPAVSGAAGTGLATVVRGRYGQWLDAGGTLMPRDAVAGARHYGTRHDDLHRFRILIRVDPVD